jgi:predicted HTH transcriptional regulator
LQKQKRVLDAKIKSFITEDTTLSKNARSVLNLFDEKAEWTTPEISYTLGLNPKTAAHIVKSLVDKKYLTKYGTTKGAWYKKAK